MRLLVFPRDPNPYQTLLYTEMQRLGVRVTYIGELIPSNTLSLLLLPLEVAARRIAGARVVHLHWVFAFALPGAQRLPVMRWVAQISIGLADHSVSTNMSSSMAVMASQLNSAAAPWA